jgi:hypothetical protein
MKTKRQRITVIAVLVLLGILGWHFSYGLYFNIQHFNGWKNVQAVQSPDKVLAWRTLGSLRDVAGIASPGLVEQRAALVNQAMLDYLSGREIAINPHGQTNENASAKDAHYPATSETNKWMAMTDDMQQYGIKADQPVVVPPEIANRLSRVMLSPRNFDRSQRASCKACICLPEVVIQFKRGDREVEFWFSYYCNGVYGQRQVDFVKLPEYKADQVPSWADFTPGRPDLVRLMKLIFPKDEQIQALIEVP